MTPIPPVARLACLALLLSGCTAAKVQLEILSAEEALRRAEEYEAARLAPYEYTMAEAYLQKAREEAGFSSYRVADALARRSAQWSDRAIIFVERRGRAEVDLGTLTDDGPPPPAPEPTISAEPESEGEEGDEIEDLDDEIEIPTGDPP